MTANPDSGIDVLFGTGGAPEGVIAAAALKCVGGELQGRLRLRNDEERARGKRMGITRRRHDLQRPRSSRRAT